MVFCTCTKQGKGTAARDGFQELWQAIYPVELPLHPRLDLLETEATRHQEAIGETKDLLHKGCQVGIRKIQISREGSCCQAVIQVGTLGS